MFLASKIIKIFFYFYLLQLACGNLSFSELKELIQSPG